MVLLKFLKKKLKTRMMNQPISLVPFIVIRSMKFLSNSCDFASRIDLFTVNCATGKLDQKSKAEEIKDKGHVTTTL